MAGVRQMFLLIILQGFYLGSLCQRWTFPDTITALIGSCVEIPCTYHPAGTSGTSGTVWYLYANIGYPQVFNTKHSSSVMKEYKDRTSLVPGENSCTLRIDPVRREDGGTYYPGITRNTKTNAYEKYGTVQLDVTDSPGNINLYVSPIIREGEATILRCEAEHTCRSSPPSLQWNKPGQVQSLSVEISGGTWREESDLTYIPSYEDDGTPVQCTATYRNGLRTEKSKTLNIHYAPKIVTVTMTRNDELMEGDNVTLQCSSFSKPDVYEYEWYKGKSKLPDRGREITVTSVTRDMEPYSCAARNRVGREESALIEIPVLYAPKSVTVTIIGIEEVMEGDNVTLQCNSFSKSAVYKYEWYKGKSKLPDREREITVRNVTRDMEPYSCAARNTVGRGESAPIEIPVLYAATGVHIIMKNYHEITELLCDFLSSRPNVTHYTWMKDGSILQDKTEKTLTVYNNEESYGRYSCITHNRAGKSFSEEIHINSAASVTRDAVDLPLILGTIAGVFFLAAVILVVYLYLRKISKSKRTTTSARNVSNIMTTNHEALIEENQSGNILTQPDAMRSMSSVDVKMKENYVIYSNTEVMQPTNEVEYSEVVHVQRDHIMSRVSNGDNVEYATVRR